MSKSAHNILVAASVALMMFGYVSQADAQRSGDQTSSLSLLGNIQVQEELDLVDDQIKEIEELGSEMRASMREMVNSCLLYTSPSPRDLSTSRMPSSA